MFSHNFQMRTPIPAFTNGYKLWVFFFVILKNVFFSFFLEVEWVSEMVLVHYIPCSQQFSSFCSYTFFFLHLYLLCHRSTQNLQGNYHLVLSPKFLKSSLYNIKRLTMPSQTMQPSNSCCKITGQPWNIGPRSTKSPAS